MSRRFKGNQYGTFSVRSKKLFRNKKVISSTVLVLLAVAVFGFVQMKKDKVILVSEEPKIVDAVLPGWWYAEYFGISICDQDNCKSDADPDNDKLTNAQEFYYRSNPINRDTNNNGLTDGEDVAQNYDPSKPGKVSFDEAASDENILGESLLFNSDIKEIINELVDPNSRRLPEINEDELNITSDNSKEAAVKYLEEANGTINEIFPSDLDNYLESAFLRQDQEKINTLKYNAAEGTIALKKLAVPSNLLQLHKYYLGLLELLPKVVSAPSQSALLDETDPAGNYWYDQTQSFAVLLSKIEIENKRLEKLYP
ncbi:MAG: hypothetical protein Q8P83_00775 [bacterium]|nr:hypothetical protein [bacterium]